MRLLFVKHSLVWPRSSGHDVHCYYTMRACAELGHDVSLATVVEPTSEALAGLNLTRHFRLHTDGSRNGAALHGTWLQKRFRSFWGVPDDQLFALNRAVTGFRPDVVVVAGLDALPYFPVLSGVVRVWHAADEWVWHHVSQLQPSVANLREHLWAAAVKGLYERAHTTAIDRVWVVSESERRAMRWLAGMPCVDVVPNGVDAEYFRPGDERPQEHTAVFWGRLDFGPNVQGLQWFCKEVWPLVRAKVPDARFTIVGFHATDPVRALTGNGISLVSDLPDLRSLARQHALMVLPFVSGGGVKNKLLEGAALGLPIVCTPKATHGLQALPVNALAVAGSPIEFSRTMCELWADERRRLDLGRAARSWVLANHTWTAAAHKAMAAIEASGRCA